MHGARPAAAVDDAIGAIAQRHKEFVAAFNRGDAAWIADRFYAADAVVIPPHAAPIVGREALRGFLCDVHTAARRCCVLTIDRCDVDGDLAYVVGRYNVAVRRPDGEVEEETGNLLEAWRRADDGEWWCVADMYGSDGSSTAPAAAAHGRRE